MVRALISVGLDFNISRIEVKMGDLTELSEARKLQDRLVDRAEELNAVLTRDAE